MSNKIIKETLYYSLIVPLITTLLFAICFAFASAGTWLVRLV